MSLKSCILFLSVLFAGGVFCADGSVQRKDSTGRQSEIRTMRMDCSVDEKERCLRRVSNPGQPEAERMNAVKKGIFVNEDFGCIYWPGRQPQLDRETLAKLVGGYSSSPGVGRVVFNINAMSAFFDSTAFRRVYDGVREGSDGAIIFHGHESRPGDPEHCYYELALNVGRLYEKVADPMRLRYDTCRADGAEMFCSLRMNDVHYVNLPDIPLHNDLWREKKHLLRAQYKAGSAFWNAQGFDYAHKEVREYHLALVREVLERFEMDGIELDWMRSPPFFRPGFDEAGTPLLNAFMEKVKALAGQAAGKWKHPVRIAVRVPSRPEEALKLGLDVFHWAKEGWVDIVVPSPYYETSDSDLPVELWKRLLPEETILAPCIECHLKSRPGTGMRGTLKSACGFAAAYLHKGADTVYLFNHMHPVKTMEHIGKLYDTLGDGEKLAANARRHVVTYHENPFVEGARDHFYLPEFLLPKWTTPVRIEVGGAVDGRKASILVGFPEGETVDLEVRINTVICSGSFFRKKMELPAGLDFLCFEVPEGALHDGANVVDLLHRGEKSAALKWLELDIEKK